MLKSLEVTGVNVDEAIKSALEKVNKQREDVTVEVIEKGKAGLLGFGKIPSKIKVSYNVLPLESAKEFVLQVTKYLGVTAEIDTKIDQEKRIINLNLTGKDMGIVIGRRGDTLDSIQFLCTMAINRCEEEYWRVSIDTENYRAKREEALVQYAKKMADKAIKYRKPMMLEAMNPYERSLVHSALKEIKGVTTHSTGIDPNRRVVISLEIRPFANNYKKPIQE